MIPNIPPEFYVKYCREGREERAICGPRKRGGVSVVATQHRIINPPELPAPSGFSHAVAAGNTVYLAGQIGEGETIAEQFDNAAGYLINALEAAGGTPEDLVSLQVFVTEVEEYQASLMQIGKAWRKHFGRHYPAMGLFGVTKLFVPAAKVELMGVAVIRD
jgi:enamine deaminase RidA (YjgF/YER057c/UK114 family)